MAKQQIPEQQCRTCKEWFPLTEENWHRNNSKPTGFAIHCIECAREYIRFRSHHPAHLNEPRLNTGDFGPFEAEILAESRQRLSEPVISIYKEIGELK